MLRVGFRYKTQILSVALMVPLLFMAGKVAAQDLSIFSPDLAWPDLTQDDLNRMHAAAARLFEGQSIGAVERWSNPASNDAGQVKLIRAFDANGMPCRTIDYTLIFQGGGNSPDHYVLSWCRIPGGVWKIVALPPPP
jgi:hypothetical protein